MEGISQQTSFFDKLNQTKQVQMTYMSEVKLIYLQNYCPTERLLSGFCWQDPTRLL